MLRRVDAHRQLEGGGFEVRRPFPSQSLPAVDPFLLLDHLGPVDWAPGEAIGAPDHPHRGFEAVTYILEGEHEHRDSADNHGLLGPGDVQWMTAGAGVVHSEMPTPEFCARGGRMQGFQIWVNLPAKHKMMAPRYQDIPARDIPVYRAPGVWVRVIAGQVESAVAVIDTVTPILLWHVRLEAGAAFSAALPSDHRVMAYAFAGQGAVGAEAEPIEEGQLGVFGDEGESLILHGPTSPGTEVDFLVLGGVPLREPVARYGPFVMNTVEEIHQAFADYRSGRMGTIG
jgi:redox-sensitive bicupin YhaK (pirin superfamily)